MTTVRRTRLAAHATGLVAAGPFGPLVATGYDPATVGASSLQILDPRGRLLRRHDLPFSADFLRLGPGDTVWAVRRRQDGADVLAWDLGGRPVHDVLLDSAFDSAPGSDPGPQVGAFVVLPDGFLVMWLPPRTPPLGRGLGRAVLARHDHAGSVRWATPLPFDEVAFPGLVMMEAATGWVPRPMPARPVSLVFPAFHEPLLVAADGILASVVEPTSGLGVRVFVARDDGRVVAVTDSAPFGHTAIVGPGQFLIGQQGYGAFSSARYGPDGQAERQWPSHGMMLVDRKGQFRGPEMENSLPSRSVFRVLEADGGTRTGPALTGYSTAYPAIDVHGTTVFWRDGRLTAVDEDLHARTLVDRLPESVGDRILLLGEGTLVTAAQGEIFVVGDTGLGALGEGPWPCADGGLRGNPVFGG